MSAGEEIFDAAAAAVVVVVVVDVVVVVVFLCCFRLLRGRSQFSRGVALPTGVCHRRVLCCISFVLMDM